MNDGVLSKIQERIAHYRKLKNECDEDGDIHGRRYFYTKIGELQWVLNKMKSVVFIKFKIKYPMWSFGFDIERLPHGLHIVIQFWKCSYIIIIGNYISPDQVFSDLAFAGKGCGGLKEERNQPNKK